MPTIYIPFENEIFLQTQEKFKNNTKTYRIVVANLQF